MKKCLLPRTDPIYAAKGTIPTRKNILKYLSKMDKTYKNTYQEFGMKAKSSYGEYRKLRNQYNQLHIKSAGALAIGFGIVLTAYEGGAKSQILDFMDYADNYAAHGNNLDYAAMGAILDGMGGKWATYHFWNKAN